MDTISYPVDHRNNIDIDELTKDADTLKKIIVATRKEKLALKDEREVLKGVLSSMYYGDLHRPSLTDLAYHIAYTFTFSHVNTDTYNYVKQKLASVLNYAEKGNFVINHNGAYEITPNGRQLFESYVGAQELVDMVIVSDNRKLTHEYVNQLSTIFYIPELMEEELSKMDKSSTNYATMTENHNHLQNLCKMVFVDTGSVDSDGDKLFYMRYETFKQYKKQLALMSFFGNSQK